MLGLALEGLVLAGAAASLPTLTIPGGTFGEIRFTFAGKGAGDGRARLEEGYRSLISELAGQAQILELHAAFREDVLDHTFRVVENPRPHVAGSGDLRQQGIHLVEDGGRTSSADGQDGDELVKTEVFLAFAPNGFQTIRRVIVVIGDFDSAGGLFFDRQVLDHQLVVHADDPFDRAVAVEDVDRGAVSLQRDQGFRSALGDDFLLGIHTGPEVLLGFDAAGQAGVDVKQQGRVGTFGLREQRQILLARNRPIFDNRPPYQTVLVMGGAVLVVAKDEEAVDEQGSLAASLRVVEVEGQPLFDLARAVDLEADRIHRGFTLKGSGHDGRDRRRSGRLKRHSAISVIRAEAAEVRCLSNQIYTIFIYKSQ